MLITNVGVLLHWEVILEEKDNPERYSLYNYQMEESSTILGTGRIMYNHMSDSCTIYLTLPPAWSDTVVLYI